jgi:hypothetical protein
VRDREHDARRPARQLEDGAGRVHVQEGHDRTDEAQPGGCRARRDGQQVRGHRREPDLAEGAQQQRHHRHLRPQGDGQQVGDPTRQPAHPGQTLAHLRRDDEHTGGRHGRQQQPQRAGQQRVDQDQQQHGTRQRVPGIAGHPTGEGQHHEQRHRPGTEHARLEPGEVGEGADRDQDRPTSSARPEPDQRAQGQHAGHDEGGVGARHRREVGQARGPHGRGVAVRQQPGVADHEPDQQAADRLRGACGRGGPDALADTLAGACEHARVADALPRDGVQQRPDVAAGQPPAVAAVRRRSGRGLQPPPLPQPRRRVGEGRRRPLPGDHPVHPLHPQVDVPAVGDRPRLLDDPGLDGRVTTVGGQRGQEPLRQRVDPQAGRGPDDGQHGQHGGRASGPGARVVPARGPLHPLALMPPGGCGASPSAHRRAERHQAGGPH